MTKEETERERRPELWRKCLRSDRLWHSPWVCQSSPASLEGMAPKVTREELDKTLRDQEGAGLSDEARQSARRALREMSLPPTEQYMKQYTVLKATTKRVSRRMLIEAAADREEELHASEHQVPLKNYHLPASKRILVLL